MRLGSLIEELGVEVGGNTGLDTSVTGFAIDNRKVAPGTIFGAFQGLRVNGEDFIADAVKAGAVAIVARPEAKVEGAVHIADANPRRLFAQLAARYFAPFPDVTVAVTGTNGKTSTVELARQLWRMLGHKSASIGTLGVTTSVDQVSTGLTTPDIVTFLANMSGLKREGITHAAFEASSHGLDQYRTEGLPVAAGAFTNLSRDHLDYHGDMDSYFDAKMRLFDEVVGDGGAAVIWADDEWSDKAIQRATKRGLRVLSVGVQGQALRLANRTPTQLGQTLEIEADGKLYKVNLPLFGAGGDRDAGKRPLMGKVAADLADHVIVTDDNPRSEEPSAIRAAVMAGAPGAEEIGGRRAAIAAAIGQAGGDDIVLLAGKGHEQGQIIGDRVLPFDDVTVARECAG